MKAAVLTAFGRPLDVKNVPAPVMGTGEVIVDVVAAPVLSYTNEVLSGERKYLLPVPVIPGCGAIGKVRQTGPDSAWLKPGDWVFCDPTVRSRDNALSPEIVLQGWSARGEGGQKIQQYHRMAVLLNKYAFRLKTQCPLATYRLQKRGGGVPSILCL